MDLNWYQTGPGEYALGKSVLSYPYLARATGRLGKWSLEMWRPIEGGSVHTFDQCSWEFVGRFDDLEEAKRVGYTLARLEN